MTTNVKIIKFSIVNEETRKTKAECSIEVHGFRINGMRLIERGNGEMIISFPFWKDRDGGTHEYVYAIDEQLRKEIDYIIKQTYKATTGIEVSKEVPVVEEFDTPLGLRDINIKLKQKEVELPNSILLPVSCRPVPTLLLPQSNAVENATRIRKMPTSRFLKHRTFVKKG